MTDDQPVSEERLALAQRAAALFAGHPKAIGSEEGGSVKVHDSLEHLVAHFMEVKAEPIGIYPMFIQQHEDGSREWCVNWTCFDIDWDKPKGLLPSGLQVAKRIHTAAFSMYGFRGFIERSRSKGWHVWFFYNGPCPAWAAQYWGRVILEAVHLDKMELNPKQVNLREDQLGNYVRVPYPASRPHLSEHRHFYMANIAEFIPLSQAIDEAELNLIDVDDALRASRRTSWYKDVFKTPEASTPQHSGQSEGGSGAWKSQEAGRILMDHTARIAEGGRDTTLFTIAKLMFGLRMAPTDAMARMSEIVLNQVDGDFPMEIALEKVRRAYRGMNP